MVASDPVPDPVPGMPESACAAVVPDPVTVPDPVPDPVPGTPVSASAMVVPDVKTSVSKPRKKKPRPSQPAMASCPAKSSSVPAKSVPARPPLLLSLLHRLIGRLLVTLVVVMLLKIVLVLVFTLILVVSPVLPPSSMTVLSSMSIITSIVPTCVIMSRRLLVLLLPRLCLLVPRWSFPSLPSKLFSSHRP